MSYTRVNNKRINLDFSQNIKPQLVINLCIVLQWSKFKTGQTMINYFGCGFGVKTIGYFWNVYLYSTYIEQYARETIKFYLFVLARC